MDGKLQRRVPRYGWDRAAEFYNSSWQAGLLPAHDQLLSMADPQAGQVVLDIAAGTGLVTSRLAVAVGPTGRVLGTDISDRMVGLATAGNDHQNVFFERMGAEELSVEDNVFDLSVCALGLMYVPNTTAAIAEMYRVTKPGGRAAISVWGPRNKCGWADLFPIVDAHVTSEVCPMFFHLGGEQVLENALVRAGFGYIQVDRISTEISFDNDNHALEAAFLGGPVAMAYNRFDGPTRAGVHAEYLASISAYKYGTKYRIPGEFVTAVATKS
ncbi:MAG: methyltransferase domain-containing protein [Acidimicrobiia bacterium]|nr:methyltransferase domain-containing protein [Acidimicrobiia bacterium]MDH5504389.1 methyltransferase domain-containing protein [Acidimicrobiia bacterium]